MKTRRRQYIIDKKLQMRYTLFFILISLIGNVLAVAVFNMLAMKQLDTVLWSTHISISSTDELIRPIFFSVNIINFLFVTLLLILTGVLMLKKTSGPLFRMSRDIRKITSGDLSARIELREKDDFQDVADALNSMTENLGKKFLYLKEKFEGVSGAVKMLEKGDETRDAAIKKYDAVLQHIEEVEKEINRFEP